MSLTYLIRVLKPSEKQSAPEHIAPHGTAAQSDTRLAAVQPAPAPAREKGWLPPRSE